MKRQPSVLTAVALLACFVFSACGTTGKTSRFALEFDSSQKPQVASEIRVASAAIEENAAQLIAVSVIPWGKFDSDDLRNIEQSLRDTIALNLPATLPTTESRLDIHLVVRRYVVSTSNMCVAVLACVAWAATNSKGALIFEEQFYASKKVYLGTIGLLKDSVHKAIVRRIATGSLALASGLSAESLRPTSFDDTFTSLEEAATNLPSKMVSLAPILGLVIPSGVSTVKWEVAKPSENFDWHGFLKELYSRP